MFPSGFVSNGEYNVFRTKGFTRPLSVLRLRSDARKKFSNVSVSKMEQLLSPKGILNAQTSSKHAYLHFEPPALSDGSIPCVTPSLLDEIASWKNAGASLKDVVDRLRVRCVPSGYTPMPWSQGILPMW